MPRKLTKILSLVICFFLLFEQSGFAQVAGQLDISGHILQLRNALTQDKFRPLHLRYLSYDNSNNNLSLLLDKGNLENLKNKDLENSTRTLLKYFLIGVTLPDDAFWVNLRPDSPDNVLDDSLAQTDIGKIFLEADLQLKKDTAGFTSPETPEGKEYWDKLYKKAGELLGSNNVSIPTLTRPWVVPDEIILTETDSNVYIYKATLKVLLEEDYLKNSSTYDFKDERLKQLNEYSSQLIRELIIPKLNREINTSKRYAPLRQVYYSLILARWFKDRFYGKSGLYPTIIDRGILAGLTSTQPWSKDTYFRDYQKSFKEGEYNFKVPAATIYGQTIRSYFSGGFAFGGTELPRPPRPVMGEGFVVNGPISSALRKPGEIKGTESYLAAAGVSNADADNPLGNVKASEAIGIVGGAAGPVGARQPSGEGFVDNYILDAEALLKTEGLSHNDALKDATKLIVSVLENMPEPELIANIQTAINILEEASQNNLVSGLPPIIAILKKYAKPEIKDHAGLYQELKQYFAVKKKGVEPAPVVSAAAEAAPREAFDLMSLAEQSIGEYGPQELKENAILKGQIANELKSLLIDPIAPDDREKDIKEKAREILRAHPEYLEDMFRDYLDSEFVAEYETKRIHLATQFGAKDEARANEEISQYIKNNIIAAIAITSGERMGVDINNTLLSIRKYFYRIFGNFDNEPFTNQEILPANIIFSKDGKDIDKAGATSQDMVITGILSHYSPEKKISVIYVTAVYKGRKMVFYQDVSRGTWRRIETVSQGVVAEAKAETALDLNVQLGEALDKVMMEHQPDIQIVGTLKPGQPAASEKDIEEHNTALQRKLTDAGVFSPVKLQTRMAKMGMWRYMGIPLRPEEKDARFAEYLGELKSKGHQPKAETKQITPVGVAKQGVSALVEKNIAKIFAGETEKISAGDTSADVRMLLDERGEMIAFAKEAKAFGDIAEELKTGRRSVVTVKVNIPVDGIYLLKLTVGAENLSAAVKQVFEASLEEVNKISNRNIESSEQLTVEERRLIKAMVLQMRAKGDSLDTQAELTLKGDFDIFIDAISPTVAQEFLDALNEFAAASESPMTKIAKAQKVLVLDAAVLRGLTQKIKLLSNMADTSFKGKLEVILPAEPPRPVTKIIDPKAKPEEKQLSRYFVGNLWVKAGKFWYRIWPENDKVNFQRYNETKVIKVGRANAFGLNESFSVGSAASNRYAMDEDVSGLSPAHFTVQVAKDENAYKFTLIDANSETGTTIEYTAPAITERVAAPAPATPTGEATGIVGGVTGPVEARDREALAAIRPQVTESGIYIILPRLKFNEQDKIVEDLEKERVLYAFVPFGLNIPKDTIEKIQEKLKDAAIFELLARKAEDSTTRNQFSEATKQSLQGINIVLEDLGIKWNKEIVDENKIMLGAAVGQEKKRFEQETIAQPTVTMIVNADEEGKIVKKGGTPVGLKLNILDDKLEAPKDAHVNLRKAVDEYNSNPQKAQTEAARREPQKTQEIKPTPRGKMLPFEDGTTGIVGGAAGPVESGEKREGIFILGARSSMDKNRLLAMNKNRLTKLLEEELETTVDIYGEELGRLAERLTERQLSTDRGKVATVLGADIDIPGITLLDFSVLGMAGYPGLDTSGRALGEEWEVLAPEIRVVGGRRTDWRELGTERIFLKEGQMRESLSRDLSKKSADEIAGILRKATGDPNISGADLTKSVSLIYVDEGVNKEVFKVYFETKPGEAVEVVIAAKSEKKGAPVPITKSMAILEELNGRAGAPRVGGRFQTIDGRDAFYVGFQPGETLGEIEIKDHTKILNNADMAAEAIFEVYDALKGRAPTDINRGNLVTQEGTDKAIVIDFDWTVPQTFPELFARIYSYYFRSFVGVDRLIDDLAKHYGEEKATQLLKEVSLALEEHARKKDLKLEEEIRKGWDGAEPYYGAYENSDYIFYILSFEGDFQDLQNGVLDYLERQTRSPTEGVAATEATGIVGGATGPVVAEPTAAVITAEPGGTFEDFVKLGLMNVIGEKYMVDLIWSPARDMQRDKVMMETLSNREEALARAREIYQKALLMQSEREKEEFERYVREGLISEFEGKFIIDAHWPRKAERDMAGQFGIYTDRAKAFAKARQVYKEYQEKEAARQAQAPVEVDRRVREDYERIAPVRQYEPGLEKFEIGSRFGFYGHIINGGQSTSRSTGGRRYLIDWEKDATLRTFYEKIIGKYNENKGKIPAEMKGNLLWAVFQAIDDTIRYGYTREEIRETKDVLIGEAIDLKRGVCKDMGLLAAVVLERMLTDGYLKGKVFFVRGRSHGWALYRTSAGEYFVFDVAQRSFRRKAIDNPGLARLDDLYAGGGGFGIYRQGEGMDEILRRFPEGKPDAEVSPPDYTIVPGYRPVRTQVEEVRAPAQKEVPESKPRRRWAAAVLGFLAGLFMQAPVATQETVPPKEPVRIIQGEFSSKKQEEQQAKVNQKEVDELINQLGDDDIFKREEASTKLAAMGMPVVPSLLNAKNTAKDAEVRARSSAVIKKIAETKYAPVIQALKDPKLQDIVLRTLREGRLPGIIVNEQLMSSLETFFGAKKDEDASIRAVREGATEVIVESLRRMLETPQEKYPAIVGALVKLDKNAADALLPLLDLTGPGWEFVRETAISGLGELGADAEKAMPALERLLKHPDKRTREVAENALKNIKRAIEEKKETPKQKTEGPGGVIGKAAAPEAPGIVGGATGAVGAHPSSDNDIYAAQMKLYNLKKFLDDPDFYSLFAVKKMTDELMALCQNIIKSNQDADSVKMAQDYLSYLQQYILPRIKEQEAASKEPAYVVGVNRLQPGFVPGTAKDLVRFMQELVKAGNESDIRLIETKIEETVFFDLGKSMEISEGKAGTIENLIGPALRAVSVSAAQAIARLKKEKAVVIVVKFPITINELRGIIDSGQERGFVILGDEAGRKYLIITAGSGFPTKKEHYGSFFEDSAATQVIFMHLSDIRGHSHPRYSDADPSDEDYTVDKDNFILALDEEGNMQMSFQRKGLSEFEDIVGEKNIAEELARLGVLKPSRPAGQASGIVGGVTGPVGGTGDIAITPGLEFLNFVSGTGTWVKYRTLKRNPDGNWVIEEFNKATGTWKLYTWDGSKPHMMSDSMIKDVIDNTRIRKVRNEFFAEIIPLLKQLPGVAGKTWQQTIPPADQGPVDLQMRFGISVSDALQDLWRWGDRAMKQRMIEIAKKHGLRAWAPSQEPIELKKNEKVAQAVMQALSKRIGPNWEELIEYRYDAKPTDKYLEVEIRRPGLVIKTARGETTFVKPEIHLYGRGVATGPQALGIVGGVTGPVGEKPAVTPTNILKGTFRTGNVRYSAEQVYGAQETSRTLNTWFAARTKRYFGRTQWDSEIKYNTRGGKLFKLQANNGELLGIAYAYIVPFMFADGSVQDVYMGGLMEVSEKYRGRGLGGVLIAKIIESSLSDSEIDESARGIVAVHPAEDSAYAKEGKQARDFFKQLGFTAISTTGYEVTDEEEAEKNLYYTITPKAARALIYKVRDAIEKPAPETYQALLPFPDLTEPVVQKQETPGIVGGAAGFVGEAEESFRGYESAPPYWKLFVFLYTRKYGIAKDEFMRRLNGKRIMLVGPDTDELPNQLAQQLDKSTIIAVNPVFKTDIKGSIYFIGDVIQNIKNYPVGKVDFIFSSGLFNPEYTASIRGYVKSFGANFVYAPMFKAMKEVLAEDGQIIIMTGNWGNDLLREPAELAGLACENINTESLPIYRFTLPEREQQAPGIVGGAAGTVGAPAIVDKPDKKSDLTVEYEILRKSDRKTYERLKRAETLYDATFEHGTDPDRNYLNAAIDFYAKAIKDMRNLNIAEIKLLIQESEIRYQDLLLAQRIIDKQTRGTTWEGRLITLHKRLIERLKGIRSKQDPGKPLVIVDFGIGKNGAPTTFDLVKMLKEAGLRNVRVVGVDINPEYIRQARERLSQTQLPEGITLEFRNGGFRLTEENNLSEVSLIVTSNVVQYYKPDEWKENAKLLRQALAEAGELAVSYGPQRGYTGSIYYTIYKKDGSAEKESQIPEEEVLETAAQNPASAVGGIDLRALPIITQPAPLGAAPLGQPVRPMAGTAPVRSADAEWGAIQNMINGGIIPSTERIKEYLLGRCDKANLEQEMNKVREGIADILRMEEERASSTEPALKEMLALLEAAEPAVTFGASLKKINVLPQEPMTIDEFVAEEKLM